MSARAVAAADIADCERRDGGFMGQDVNAWTSLGYAAVGVLVAVVVLRRRLPRAFLALAAVTVVEGLGSLLYHGGRGDAAQLLHDVPLVAALGFVAGWQAGRLARRPQVTSTAALAGLVAGLLAGTGAWALGASPNVAVVGAVAVIVVAELAAWRAGQERIWHVPLLALGVAAAVTWAAGTSASPLCDAESWLQPHGLWHVLSALVALGWVDQALAAADPVRAPRLARRAIDRVLGLAAVLLARGFFRSIEVAGRERLQRHRPTLIVANHGNGFVDPIVVTAVLGRLPRFLAKAALWRVVIARPFLALTGVLPVYRLADGDRSDNRRVFEACHQELARGATVAIFPEGTTGDRAGLDRVKSGAARIALGAVPTTPSLVIVPIGLAFESRTETRGRTWALVGEPIEVAAHARHPLVDPDRPDRADVRALTDEITAALEAVSPEFESVEEREVLRAAARVRRNADAGHREAGFGTVELLARRLATAPAEARREVVDAYARYATQLQLIGLSDRQLGPASMSAARVIGSVAALFALTSVVVTATLIHLPALVIVLAATAAVRSTTTKGTVRLLVGLAAFLLTWIVAGVVLADGWRAVATAALIAVEGALALLVWTPMTRLAATLWGRLRARDRVGLLPPVKEARAELMLAVDRAVSATVRAATVQAATPGGAGGTEAHRVASD
jgi:glycerol-3-phosphate O-acyltransferase/dihydroxyacetone phosphate acyltransferase